MSVEEAKRQAALEGEARRLGIPVWQLEMARAVPSDVIADLVRDLRQPQQLRSAIEQAPRRPSFREPAKLETPYVREVDRVAEGFAAEDLRERLAKARGR